MTKRQPVTIQSSVTPEQREELAKILDRLTGTPIARTGDIVMEDAAGKRYVISTQVGDKTHVVIDRPGGTEVVRPSEESDPSD